MTAVIEFTDLPAITIEFTDEEGELIIMESAGTPITMEVFEGGIIVQGVGSGGSGDLVYGETLNGVQDGFNATFTTQSPFVPGQVTPKIGGIDLTIIQDFQTIGNQTIQFVSAPQPGENLSVDYTKE